MTSVDSYGRAALEFIQQIRQSSAPAADCLEHIQGQYGSRAAYLAAFALATLKRSQDQYHHVPVIETLQGFTYYEEMQNHLDALKAFEDAARYLFPTIDGRDEAQL